MEKSSFSLDRIPNNLCMGVNYTTRIYFSFWIEHFLCERRLRCLVSPSLRFERSKRKKETRRFHSFQLLFYCSPRANTRDDRGNNGEYSNWNWRKQQQFFRWKNFGSHFTICNDRGPLIVSWAQYVRKIISRNRTSDGDYSLSSRIRIYGTKWREIRWAVNFTVNRHFIIGQPPWFFS